MILGRPSPTYDKYYKYLLGYTKKLEAAFKDNTPSRKANSSETDYLTPYSPLDSCYNNATDLLTYISDHDHDDDIDMI